MKGINNMRIGVKVQIATVTIIVLFVVISVAAIALRTILTAQVGTTVAATEAALQINGLSDLVKQYMAGARPFTTLQQDYDAYQNTMKSKYSGVLSQKVSIKDAAGGANTTASLEEHVTKIWQEVGQAEALAQQNLKIETDVIAPSNDSISKSNGFLSSISERLSDPVQQRKVSMLERKVIQGASVNTNSGFTIQLLFKDMKLDLANKDKLFQYLDQAEQNATADVQRLAGTDFAQLPKDSVAAIGKTRELATQYVQNETSREGIASQVAGDLASLVSALNGNLAKNTRDSFARITNIINTAFILFAIFVALVVALQILISRSITRPLKKGVGFAQLVANGDFTQQLDIMQKDETGILARALNGMSVKLKDMVAIVQENAEQIASSSEEISASAQKLAEGAQSQASTLEETSASVEELTSSVDQVAEHAQSQASAVEQGQHRWPGAEVHRRGIGKSQRHLRPCQGIRRRSDGGGQGGAAGSGRDQPDSGQLGEDRGDRRRHIGHRRPDQPAGTECLHRGGAGRRARPRVRRSGRRGEQACRQERGLDQGDREPDQGEREERHRRGEDRQGRADDDGADPRRRPEGEGNDREPFGIDEPAGGGGSTAVRGPHERERNEPEHIGCDRRADDQREAGVQGRGERERDHAVRRLVRGGDVLGHGAALHHGAGAAAADGAVQDRGRQWFFEMDGNGHVKNDGDGKARKAKLEIVNTSNRT